MNETQNTGERTLLGLVLYYAILVKKHKDNIDIESIQYSIVGAKEKFIAIDLHINPYITNAKVTLSACKSVWLKKF